MKSYISQLIVLIILLSACSGNIENAHEKLVREPDSSDTISLSEKVFYFTPTFDSTSCSNYIGCDCCVARLLLLNETDFILISYCIADQEFHPGKYEFANEKLYLHYSDVYIHHEYDWAEDIDTSGTATASYVIKVKEGKGSRIEFSSFYCGDNLVFTLDNEQETTFGIEDSVLATDLIWKMIRSGIWDKLESL